MDPLSRALQVNHGFQRKRTVAYLSFRLDAGFGLLKLALWG